MRAAREREMKELTAEIFDVKRFAIHDGDGIRTTVFFKGCPLHCVWCHNPEGIAPYPELQFAPERCAGCGECVRVCPNGVHALENKMHTLRRTACSACGRCAEACLTNALTLCGRRMTLEQVLQTVLADMPFYGETGGVTLSGGECLCQPEFCAALLRALHARSVNTAVDTSGCVPRSAIEQVLDAADIFLYDIKHIDPEQHRRYTGVDNALILDNLRFLNEKGKRIEIRIPLIPGVNDDVQTISQIGALLARMQMVEKVRVLPYNNLAGSKYTLLGRQNTMPACQPPAEVSLREIRALLASYSLRVI